MMLQTGLSDSHLRRELGAIRNPTLPGFSEKIEGYEQARKTEPEAAYGNAAQRPASNRRQPAEGGRPANRNSAPRNRCMLARPARQLFTGHRSVAIHIFGCNR